MTLRLKAVLAEKSVSYRTLAGGIGVSAGTLSAIVNQGRWPKRPGRADLETAIRDRLGDGLPDDLFEEVADAEPNPRPPETQPEDIMLPEKCTLSDAARQRFQLARDPFAVPPETLYLSTEIHFIREVLYQTATAGGFTAVVGESGAGKTALLADLHRRLRDERSPAILIEPFVLEMSDRGGRDGKELRMGDVLDAIARSVDPRGKISQRRDKRQADIVQMLATSAGAGSRHCIVVEEAHDCHANTLRGLKRLYDLAYRQGLKLSILLIGQPELGLKLDRRNHALREVWQRVDIHALRPLNGRVGPFLAHLFEAAGGRASQIFDDGAYEAMEKQLQHWDAGVKAYVSDCYALAVMNLATAAMNEAAVLMAPKVSADLVEGV